MKHLSPLLILLSFSLSVSAQKEMRRDYSSYFDKGNKIAGIELAIAGDYDTYLQLDISKSNKDYGLLLLPSYGWFVEKNWMIGVQALAGFY